MTKLIKHRRKLYLSVGLPGTCPECGEPTPFRRASMLTEQRMEPWVIDFDLLFALAATLATKNISCSKCKRRPARLHWIEIGEAAVVGPVCSSCLRSLRHDVPVYVASPSNGTMREAALVRAFAPKPPRVTASTSNLF